MISSAQLKASRAMLGLDQRELADLCGVSLPTIQRMESSGGTVRGMIDTLVKIVAALDAAGIELLGDNAPSSGVGRGVRLKEAQVQRVPVSAVKGKDATDDTDAA
ncbi:MAG: helix-turn-helix domain-containing protein [Rhodospirillaceae bacterium]